MEFKYLNSSVLNKHYSPEAIRESYSNIMGVQKKVTNNKRDLQDIRESQ